MIILAEARLAMMHHDSAPRPQRYRFATPNLHASCTGRFSWFNTLWLCFTKCRAMLPSFCLAQLRLPGIYWRKENALMGLLSGFFFEQELTIEKLTSRVRGTDYGRSTKASSLLQTPE